MRGRTEYATVTEAEPPFGSAGSSATSSFPFAASSVNFCGFPSRSTFETTIGVAASSESSVRGERSETKAIVAAPEISSFSMSKASSAL